MADERVDVEILTLGIDQTGPVQDAGEANAMLDCRVYVNGTEIPRVVSALVEAASNEFVQVTVRLAPTSVTVTPVSDAAWQALELAE